MEKLDLKQIFDSNLCSFHVAVKAKKAGFTCANTFYAYDENGNVTDAGWMENGGQGEIKGLLASLPKFKAPTLYPAINICMAIGLIEDTTLDISKCEFKHTFTTKGEWKYMFIYNKDEMFSERLADLMVLVWLKYKK